jgi:hypothetical protein
MAYRKSPTCQRESEEGGQRVQIGWTTDVWASSAEKRACGLWALSSRTHMSAPVGCWASGRGNVEVGRMPAPGPVRHVYSFLFYFLFSLSQFKLQFEFKFDFCDKLVSKLNIPLE